MDRSRRLILRAALALAALASLPKALLAAAWPAKAFGATKASTAMSELFGTDQTTSSDEITLGAPDIAENGAAVPLSIETTLADVQSVSVIVDNNPRPLVVSFEIHPGTAAHVACRIKMAETSQVRAVVKTANGLFSTEKKVKVTIGGCG